MPLPSSQWETLSEPSRPMTRSQLRRMHEKVLPRSITITPSEAMSISTIAEKDEMYEEVSEPDSTHSVFETNSHHLSAASSASASASAVSPSSPTSKEACSPDLQTILAVLAPSDLFASLLTVVPDWIALHLVLLQPSMCVSSLTSWAWMILRSMHFFGATSKSPPIGQLRQPLMRCAFKTMLLLLALFFAWCERAQNESHTTWVKFFEFAWADPGHESAALALLVVNHLYWEAAERWMFYKKHDWQSSVSQLLADTRFRYERIVMLVYLLSLSAPIYLFESSTYLYWYVIGVILLILVKTESVVENGDPFATAIHCSGFLVILGVALMLCIQRTYFLWFIKFSNVIPHFIKFIVTTDNHELKVRAEIKMLKHLCDTMAVIIMPKIVTTVMLAAVS